VVLSVGNAGVRSPLVPDTDVSMKFKMAAMGLP